MSPTPRNSDKEESSFGSQKRDWTLVWRVLTFGVGLLSTSLSAVMIYAGSSYVRAVANEIVDARFTAMMDIPGRMNAMEILARDRAVILKELASHDAQADQILARVLNMVENQQKQIDRFQFVVDRQQTLIDQLTARRP